MLFIIGIMAMFIILERIKNMKKIITILIITILICTLTSCTKELSVTCTHQKHMEYVITEEQQVAFKEAFDELDLQKSFDYFEKHTAYFGFIYYTIKYNGTTQGIGIQKELSLVEYKRKMYYIDPYSKIFDVAREIDVDNGNEEQFGCLLTRGDAYKFDFATLYGYDGFTEKEIEQLDFSFDTWLSSGWTPINELMQLMGLEDDNTSTLTDLFISLSDDVIEINEEVFYKNIKIKCFQKINQPDFAYGFLIKHK